MEGRTVFRVAMTDISSSREQSLDDRHVPPVGSVAEWSPVPLAARVYIDLL